MPKVLTILKKMIETGREIGQYLSFSAVKAVLANCATSPEICAEDFYSKTYGTTLSFLLRGTTGTQTEDIIV